MSRDKASINHTKLASGVADSLEELSQDMTYWNDLIGEYGSEPMMQRFIIELYVIVVEFLTEVFRQWSKSPWKRYGNSLSLSKSLILSVTYCIDPAVAMTPSWRNPAYSP